MEKEYTVGQYLVKRLSQIGLEHLFSIAGDYSIDWINKYIDVKDGPIKLVQEVSELCAGYAADGYARLKGIGALCTTYSAGALSAANAIAGAYVECVPIVLINGTPSIKRTLTFEQTGFAAHHFISGRQTDRQVFDYITAAAVRLESAEMAPMLIDYALTQCITQRRPVYIELLQDIVNLKCTEPRGTLEPAKILSDKPGLDASIQMLKGQLEKAANPIIWIGVEIDRLGLRKKAEKLLKTLKLPYVSELLSKGALSENDKLFAGVFDGPASSAATQDLTKKSDFVLALGVWLTDINDLAAQADLSKTTFVSLNTVKFGAYFSAQVALEDLIDGLQAASVKCKPQPLPKKTAVTAFNAKPSDTITYQGFYDFIQHSNYINKNTIIGADSSLNYFGSLLLKVDAPRSYIIQSSYSAIGYIGPAATGLSLAKNDNQRVIVFSGDGGFQMSAQCLSTQTRFELNPIIFIIDNGVYGVEQWLADASVFDKDTATATSAIQSNVSANKEAETKTIASVNTSINTAGSALAGTGGNTMNKIEDKASQNGGEKQFYNSCIIHRWNYSKLADVFGCQGWKVNTYAGLEAAVKGAFANHNKPSIIQVVVPDKLIPYNAEWKIAVDSKV